MPTELRRREDVPQQDRWRVDALYADDAAWEADYAEAQHLPAEIAAYEGRLTESDGVLAEALRVWFDAIRHVEKVWVYAHLRSDEDLGNSKYQSMMERARSSYIQLSTAGSFIAPEILTIPDEIMDEWMAGEPLTPYRVWLEDLLRSKPHVLTPPEERLMSMAGEPLSSLQRVFSVLKNVDLAARLPRVPNEEGEEQQLTHGIFIKMLEARDRSVRKAAFDAYYAEFRGNRHTIATALDGSVKTHIFEARARRFPSALEAALFNDNVEVSVYDALISAVHDALPAFYRYMALRKRLLGVDKMHLYDVYVPVVPAIEVEYDYDEAVEMIHAALRPLGDEYMAAARDGMLGGWVDRYENVGKRSGAYSSGCYDSMPYILMNYTGTLDSVFTLAHELGHSMHSWYSNRSQPYHLADYRILVAEVASTTNESLLNDHLLSVTDDKAMRAYLIDRYLDSFRATLFRQTMFAEFEKIIHARAEEGQPLTVELLDGIYYDLVKLYFGDDVAFDEEDEPIAWEWSRIDHFFYNFYVYKYATGMSSAIAIARSILAGEEGALERYLRFLQSGSSKYPLDLLRDAGVDLTTPEPVGAALAEFERLVGELEQLMA
ncbi:MAG TPA: oligoendopeptidase F [Chloroflexi bacterium]|jgi:oligoendopeptidase F|nr:oligoendopeptidase F [Chloroflexota bacterium]